MAALVATPAQLELINSLSQDEIPIKLRCAIDSRLAVNAFRLPCCDQSICESCQSTLPSTCPVCEHSPVSAEDCKPNKSLRTTIKVFLRTEEKKREAIRAKESQDSVPVTPLVEAPLTPVEEPKPEEASNEAPIKVEVNTQVPVTTEPEEIAPSSDAVAGVEHIDEDQKDVPQPTIEEISPDRKPLETHGDTATGEGNENGVVQLDAEDEDAKEVAEGNAATDFSGMNMNGDFNQMQMMMAMQNGMGAGGFGNFPMMGMPGMSMDPMMMQNMFMNGGFGAGGMGMNGMNMGMGMGGFNGGSGAGFNGWNGQQNSWNVGPDNFNPPNPAGMMGHGDYRANNSGYAQNASGFNQQGNYGRSQYNDFNSYGNNQGYRGRGRGRGGYGRGGYGYGQHDFSHQGAQNFGQQQQQNGPSETGSIAPESKPESGNVDEFGRELRQPSQAGEGDKPEGSKSVAIVENDAKAEDNPDQKKTNEIPGEDTQTRHEDGAPMPIKSLDEDNAAYHQMNGGYGNSYGAYSQPYGGRNGSFGMQPPVLKPDVPINAPTGPKAMREGLPNVGYRGRQFPQPGASNSMTNNSVSGSVRAESEMGGDRQKSRSPSRERSRERSRDRKRSRSRERHHRRHRHRSESLSEDEKETQRRRERRRERRQRREEEDARAEIDDDAPEEKKYDAERSRSASPSDAKRSSHHRSRREKDKYRESDREKDRDHKSSSHRHRSHRSRRDDRSRSRDKERERDRDRENRRRHSRRESPEPSDREKGEKDSIPPTPVEESGQSRKLSVISNPLNGLEIRGASSRRKAITSETPVIPTGPRGERDRPRDSEKEKSGSGRSHHESISSRHRDSETRSSRDNRDRNHSLSTSADKDKDKSSKSNSKTAVDPHTLEREARNRERLLKEAQRIAGLTGALGQKRSRDDGAQEEKITSGGSRKKGRRGGVVGEEDEESRMRRLEAEREGARWA